MRKKIILISIIALAIVLAFSANKIVSNYLTSTISKLLLSKQTVESNDHIKNIDVNLWNRSIRINDIRIAPSKKSLVSLIDKTSKTKATKNLSVSSIELKGISLSQLIFNKNISIEKVVLNDLLIHKLTNSKIREREKPKPIHFNIDSIPIKGINGFKIGEIIFHNLSYQEYDFSINETVLETNPISFKTNGIALERNGPNNFKLATSKHSFDINNIVFDFKNSKYSYKVGSINIDLHKQDINIKDIVIKPKIEKQALADSQKFNTEIYDVEIENIALYKIDYEKIINGKGFLIDEVEIENLAVTIFKDQSKPFDTKNQKKLPHTKLKKMNDPLLINTLTIKNSSVLLTQKMDKNDLTMKVPIKKLNATITNITSIESYRQQPMNLVAEAFIMNTGNTSLKMSFDLTDSSEYFTFSGTLGKSKMELFDSALYPILGLKILEGEVDKLHFSATANEKEANGKMTFEYHDLKATVFKKNSSERNRFLSWTVNTLVRKSNPHKNKPPKQVDMHYERVKHKGLGNFFWRTIQSGIIETIAPGGNKNKHHKKEKHEHEHHKHEHHHKKHKI